jgi:hypothetical protein
MPYAGNVCPSTASHLCEASAGVLREEAANGSRKSRAENGLCKRNFAWLCLTCAPHREPLDSKALYELDLVEPRGVEPLTSCMPCKRSPN